MPIPSLPVEIKELMTLQVTWEKFGGFTGKAEPVYSAAVKLGCWLEPFGSQSGGAVAYRKQDGTVVEPRYILLFSGDNPVVRDISLYDLFTLPSVETTDKPLQAVNVLTYAGPPFDNLNPWLIEVIL